MPGRVSVDLAQLAASGKHAARTERRIDFISGAENKVPESAVVKRQHAVSHVWTTATHVGPGLVNLGNTCFLNSVLQCLTHTPPLAEALLGNSHRRSCPTKPRFCVLCALESHVQACLRHPVTKALSPRPFVDNLKRISRQMRPGRQEDAHEFARFLIEGLQKSESIASNCKPEATLANKVFGGALRSRIRCLTCKATSDTIDPIMDISLDIKHCQNIKQAFGRFTEPELLNKQNQYRCSKCNALRDARKQITIQKPPNVLTVQLKRFGFMHAMGAKISKPIMFEPQLCLDPFMSKPTANNSTVYDLSAVLVHSGGSCYSGHYYSFVRAPNRNWYAMDDSHVQQVSMKNVLAQQAYILFYVKRSSSLSAAPDSGASIGVANASVVEKPGKTVLQNRENAKSPLQPNYQSNKPLPATIKVMPGVIPSNTDRTPKKAAAQNFLDALSDKIAKKDAEPDIKHALNGALHQNENVPMNHVDDVKTALGSPSTPITVSKKHEYRLSPSCNATRSWVVENHNDSNGPIRSSPQSYFSTISWNAPPKDSDQSISQWDEVDRTLLFKRQELLDTQTQSRKLKRPSRDEIEYDRPRISKKQRRWQNEQNGHMNGFHHKKNEFHRHQNGSWKPHDHAHGHSHHNHGHNHGHHHGHQHFNGHKHAHKHGHHRSNGHHHH